MSKTSTSKYISVFIPTFNGERYLAECIEAVLGQELPKGYDLEFLITDSGSKDSTLDIIHAYKDKIKLTTIPNSEFSHGVTRSKAAHVAKGEFVLFLTQDATPAHNRWLINMIEPFFLSNKVGCVFGRQTPRAHAAPTIKREVYGAFGSAGTPDSITINRQLSLVDFKEVSKLNTFFSDANSAAKRSLLIGDVPFRNVHYAEDQALAEDMQNKGYLKAYAPQGEVLHSNDYTATEYRRRKFDEYIGLYKSLGVTFKPSNKNLLLGWIRPTIKDYKFIIKDASYGPKLKIKWLVLSPAYNYGNCAGKYYAAKNYKNDSEITKHSLESELRNK